MDGKKIIALVGMPGAGKSEAANILTTKNIPFVRFGELTDEALHEKGLPLTPENERQVREQFRKDLGMAAYAIKAKPKIEAALTDHDTVALDGLYSWEEYILLKKQFPQLLLIHIFAEPSVRYSRLAKREIRPISPEEARNRDIVEIENLNKGGPIAIADYLIENNDDSMIHLQTKLEELLVRL